MAETTDDQPLGGEQALRKVAELIAGDQLKTPDEPPAAAPETPPSKEPSFDELLTGSGEDSKPNKSQLEALAEGANVTLEDLYKTEIPMKNREPMSLGELKDLAAKQLQVEDWDTQRQQAENNLLKQQQELAQAVELLGDKLSPELVDQARQRNELYHAEQARMLTGVLPQVKDAEGLTQVQTNVRGVLSDYGFMPQEQAAVVDHRLIKMMHDYGELRARFERAAQRMEALKQGAAPASRKTPKPPEPTQPAKPTTAQAPSDKVPDVLNVLSQAMSKKQ